MNGVWSLSPTHIRSPVWVMLKISICNLFWLAEYQCKCVVQPKILVLIINLFSLNLISREIKGERGSSSLNLRPLGGGGARKRTRANKRGGGESKLGNLEQMYFLNAPLWVLAFNHYSFHQKQPENFSFCSFCAIHFV